jgi:hypothetical protein
MEFMVRSGRIDRWWEWKVVQCRYFLGGDFDLDGRISVAGSKVVFLVRDCFISGKSFWEFLVVVTHLKPNFIWMHLSLQFYFSNLIKRCHCRRIGLFQLIKRYRILSHDNLSTLTSNHNRSFGQFGRADADEVVTPGTELLKGGVD